MENLNIIAENYSNSIINNEFNNLDDAVKSEIKLAIMNAFIEGNKVNIINTTLENSIQEDDIDPFEDSIDDEDGGTYDASVDDMEDSTPMDISEYVA